MDPQPPEVGLPSPVAEPIDGMQVREVEGERLYGQFFTAADSQ
ncbi:MAG: hypothetical protein LKCHEGNO_01924 [Burkholderiaceae bacterium]|nr:hypothetical protein [Burkholderiaceae bacterium]